MESMLTFFPSFFLRLKIFSRFKSVEDEPQFNSQDLENYAKEHVLYYFSEISSG